MPDVVNGSEGDDGEPREHDWSAEVGDEFEEDGEESPEQGAGHFQPPEDQADEDALADVDGEGDQKIAHDDALGLIDDVFGGLFIAPEGNDFDEFFDEEVAGGEQEVEEEEDLDEFADKLSGAAYEAGSQTGVGWRRRCGVQRRGRGGGGALGGVLELGGDFLDLLDGLAELVELLAGGGEALRGVAEPVLQWGSQG